MTEETRKPSVTINGKTYELDSLSDAQRSTVILLKQTDDEIVMLQGKLAILKAGWTSMVTALEQSLEDQSEEAEVVEG